MWSQSFAGARLCPLARPQSHGTAISWDPHPQLAPRRIEGPAVSQHGHASTRCQATRSDADLDDLMTRAEGALSRARKALSSRQDSAVASQTDAPAFIPASLTFGTPLSKSPVKRKAPRRDVPQRRDTQPRDPEASSGVQSPDVDSRDESNVSSRSRTKSSKSSGRQSFRYESRQADSGVSRAPRRQERNERRRGEGRSRQAETSTPSQDAPSGPMPAPPSGWGSDQASAPTMQLQRKPAQQQAETMLAEAEPAQELWLRTSVRCLPSRMLLMEH